MFNLDLDFGSLDRYIERWWALFFKADYIQSDYIVGE